MKVVLAAMILALVATSSNAQCYRKRAGGAACVGGYATGYLSDCSTPCSVGRSADKKKPVAAKAAAPNDAVTASPPSQSMAAPLEKPAASGTSK